MKRMQTPYAVRTSFISFAALIAALGAPALGQEASSEDQVITNEESEGPGAPLYIGPSDMRRVQQQLNQEGYDSGNVDGTWGDQTVSALCSFQEAEGIEPTGHITPETLSALDLEDVFTSGSEEGEDGGEGEDDQVITQETSDTGACGGGDTSATADSSASGSSEGNSAGSATRSHTDDSGGTAVYLSTSDIREIKQSLNQAGYDAGDVDGTADEDLASALRSYQEAEGLEPTGTLTTRTVASLGVTDISFLASGNGNGNNSDGGNSGGDNSDEGNSGGDDSDGNSNEGGDSGSSGENGDSNGNDNSESEGGN